MAGGIDWFRWHHGSVTDPKFQLVARKAGASLPDVLAVWAYLLEKASAANFRGCFGEIDCEAVDCLFGFCDGATDSIMQQMVERKLISDEYIVAWEKRQPKRERDDDNSTERVRAFRQKQRTETPRNATERQETPRGEERRVEKKEKGGDYSTAVAPAKAAPPPFVPDGKPEPEDPPADHRDTDAPPQPSLAGRACLAMRGANVNDVNPYHPDLLRLLAAGVTPDDIGATAAECVARGKGRMAYVLRTIESRRAAAAQAPPVAAQQAVTVPSADAGRTAAYLAAQASRGATSPPAHVLAKLRSIAPGGAA